MAKTITRDDLKFWVFLLSFIVTVVIWGTRLEGRVTALNNTTQSKGAKLRQEFEADSALLQEINERTIRMEVNQEMLIKKMEEHFK